MKHVRVVLLLLLFGLLPAGLWAAVGCDLNDPDRDVKKLFPESTGYKTHYMSVDRIGDKQALGRIEQRLGDRFHGLYETLDVPYTIYEIQKGPESVGYIHGVNQKGAYGGIQVFLALDKSGRIKSFYIQKLTSRAAKELRSPAFGRQFEGLGFGDFESYSVSSGLATEGPVRAIKNPSPGSAADFRAILRATKKNLVLMDEFVFRQAGDATPQNHREGK